MNWSKYNFILLAALLAVLALAACQAEATPAPAPTAVPTLAAPTATPTVEPTAAPTEAANEATGATAMDAISEDDLALLWTSPSTCRWTRLASCASASSCPTSK